MCGGEEEGEGKDVDSEAAGGLVWLSLPAAPLSSLTLHTFACITSPFRRLRWRRLRNSLLPLEHSVTQ